MTTKPKATIEHNLKECTVEIAAQRYAINPDTFKTMSAWFSIQATFTIDPNKKFRNFSLTKLTRFRKFSWENEGRIVTAILLTDTKTTVRLHPTDRDLNGVDIELTEPKRITLAQARGLCAKGAYMCEIDGNDRLQSIAVARF